MNELHLVKDPEWWRGAVIYQIYPRSFQDSNGDGVGDLPGILQRLPYIASLGVDAIWISPFFTSPMKDFGYDVSNYHDVDPMFGSLADFDRVVQSAHQLGLKVMIDLVLSHTSDQHPWFVESRTSRNNPKSDWYVWADPKPDGTPPNNWPSIFGGPAWSWDPRREQYFMHNFLSSQPDLNLHNMDVQDALLDVARFWLHRGADGFRLDTINFYFHDKKLRDNPPLDPAERSDAIAPSVNPYNHQRHLYSKNQPENIAFLKRFRKVLNPSNAAAVGEIGDAQRGLEILAEYTSGNDKMQMSYAFEFLAPEIPTAKRFAEVFAQFDKVVSDGWPCWAFSNHDVARHVTRWNLSPRAQAAYTAILMCLRGSVCLYQGEELGLPEAEVPFECIQDPYGREFWPNFKGRDGCRTPMVWDDSNLHGGFSSGNSTWLPIPHEHLAHAPVRQEENPSSILHLYRAAIAFRNKHAALRIGSQTTLTAKGNVISFERRDGDTRIFCAFNLADEASKLSFPKGDWETIGDELGGSHESDDGFIHFGPWQPFFAITPHPEEETN